jgi:hypothetical protein
MIKSAGIIIGSAAALLGGPQSAGATQWYYDHRVIPVGERVSVPAHGTLKLYLKERPPGRQEELVCATTGTQVFWNTATTGMGKTASIALSCTAPCGTVTISPQLPWGQQTLLAPAPFALPDEWPGVRMTLRCGSRDYGALEGKLRPVSGDGDPNDAKDEQDSFLDFRSGREFQQTLHSPTDPAISLTFLGYYLLGSGSGHSQTVVQGRA